ncbi:MAG: PEP-CTERM sorting domain-containing protein [Planctomycetota bacterium]
MSVSYAQSIATFVVVVALLAAGQAHAAVFATYDADQHNANGFLFDDFDDFFNVDTSGGVINIDLVNEVAPGDGLFGGMGSDIVADFDAATTQLVVDLTVGPNNVANAFRVTLRDSDGVGIGDEHVYEFDISTLTPGVATTLTVPLSNGPLFTQGAFGQIAGDGIQNFGLTQMQIQSVFDNPDRLNILVDSVKLEDPDNPLLIEYTASTFDTQIQSFTFESFQDFGAFDTNGETIIINADSGAPAGSEGTGGGAGFNGLNIDFDATEYQIEFEAKLLPGNTATQVNLLLGDDDGDDSGPMMGSDDYIFAVDLANFNSTDFSTFTLPLGTGSESSIETTFAFLNGGDGLQNFGLSQMQIQADADTGGVLNLEVARFAIVEKPPTGPGDFDGDGDVDGNDFLAWQQGSSPNPLSAADLAEWQGAYGGGSLGAAAVPEPTSYVLLLGAIAAGSLYRRN